MKIAVINLMRSQDRRELIERGLTRLGVAFEFFRGIDAQLGEHAAVSRYDEEAAMRYLGRPLSAGEVGCFASHYLLWQRCLRERTPLAIMEDDTAVDERFAPALERAEQLLPVYPLLRLGVTAEGRGSKVVLPMSHGFEVVSLTPGTFGTQCYVLSDAAAKMLLDGAEVWSLPVDIYFDRPQIHGVKRFGLRPYSVKHADQAVYESVIGDERYGLWPDPMVRIRSQVEKAMAARGRRLK